MGFFGTKKKIVVQPPTPDINDIMVHREAVAEEYRQKRSAIPKDEARKAAELLEDPRIAAAGFSIATQCKDNIPECPVKRLVSCRSGDVLYYDAVTETDLPTFAFVAAVMRYVERREVTNVLISIRHRVAALGLNVANLSSFESEQHEVFGFKEMRYKRTHAGLQKFLFDLNAEEIFHRVCLRFGSDFQRLNWYVLKGERDFSLYMGRTVGVLNFCEQSIKAIEKYIKEADDAAAPE